MCVQLQDRESLVTLLVGSRYGISQILNHQLNMISTIIDFHYITRIEVMSETDRISMVKIYLQDIQVCTCHRGNIHWHTFTRLYKPLSLCSISL